MPKGGLNSERILVLVRRRRDTEVAVNLFNASGFAAHICSDIRDLARELKRGAGCAIISEEEVTGGAIKELQGWIAEQPAWSDFPIVVLTGRANTSTRDLAAQRLQELLGNVTFLERPFHSTTLVSVARSAMRSRQRQYQARELLERFELLARELQHRTKNLLTVIVSIATASLRGGQGPDAFIARLHALATAQDLLMQSDGQGVLMRDLVHTVLSGFGARVSHDGPPVHLTPSIAQGFALIMHELATNAVKYGALSVDNGRVAARWSLHADGIEPELHFHWQERGGPPAQPPRERGFGMVLLENAVASTDSPPTFTYDAEGFTYELKTSLPLAEQR
jgi:two-component sensor histidine kinase